MKKVFVAIIGIILLVASIYGCSVNNSSANNMSKYVGVYDNVPDAGESYKDNHITLYLDSDGTYNYITVNKQIKTTTYQGKGTWTISNNTIVFKSDTGSIERWDLSKKPVTSDQLNSKGKEYEKRYGLPLFKFQGYKSMWKIK